TIFFNVICNPSSSAPERECRPEDNRESKMLYNVKSVLDGGYCRTLRDFQSDVPHCLFKQLPVFSFLDRMQLRAYQLHLVAVEHSCLRQFHCQVESSLSAHGRQYRIGSLLFDDQLNKLNRQGLNVNSVSGLGVGHYRCRVGIHQYYRISLFTKGFTRLRPRIVELTCLANHNRT